MALTQWGGMLCRAAYQRDAAAWQTNYDELKRHYSTDYSSYESHSSEQQRADQPAAAASPAAFFAHLEPGSAPAPDGGGAQ